MSINEQRTECRVTGRVQMVMFRDFTARTARALDIRGTVENRIDGSVHVVAEGEGVALDKLEVALRRGPMLARVDDVVCRRGDATGEFADFSILY